MATYETEMDLDHMYTGQDGGLAYLMISRRNPDYAIRYSHFQRRNNRIAYICFHCDRVRKNKKTSRANNHRFFVTRVFEATPTEWIGNPDRDEPHACGFPLPEHKIQEMFKSLFDQLPHTTLTVLENTEWIFDFEASTIVALRETLPNISVIRGCSFHFAQSLNRKISSLFREGTMDLIQVEKWVNRCRACVFLSLDLVRLYKLFEVPPSFVAFPADVQKACSDFSKYLVGTYQCGAVFKNIWSQYGNLRHRTSNFAEGYHSGLKKEFKQRSPTLDLALEAIHSRLSQSRLDIQIVAQGSTVPNHMRNQTQDRLSVVAFKMQSFKEKVERYQRSQCIIPLRFVIHYLDQMLMHYADFVLEVSAR